MRCVLIPLHVTKIDALIRKGFLQKDRREDSEAVQNAICDLLAQALDDPA